MLVKFLRDTDYEPTSSDSVRCYGQLRKRASVQNVERNEPDGKLSIQAVCGPMVHYFRKGATPDLTDDVAKAFIADGAAEPYDGPEINIVSSEEIRKTITDQVLA